MSFRSVSGVRARKDDALLFYEVREMGSKVFSRGYLLQKRAEPWLRRFSLRRWNTARPKPDASWLGRYQPHSPSHE